jgi:hypothetical protein
MNGRPERKTSAEDKFPADPLRRSLLGGCLAGFEGGFQSGARWVTDCRLLASGMSFE